MNNGEYKYILKLIDERNIKHKAIQMHLGMSKTMLSRKLHGKSKLSVDEAIDIKNKFFSDVPVEVLFSK